MRHHLITDHVIEMDCSFLCTTGAKAVFLFVLIAASSQGAFVSRKAPKGTVVGVRISSIVTTYCFAAIISSYDEVYPVVVGSSDDKVGRR